LLLTSLLSASPSSSSEEEDSDEKAANARFRRAKARIAELRALQEERKLQELEDELQDPRREGRSSRSAPPTRVVPAAVGGALAPMAMGFQFTPAELQMQQQLMAVQLLQKVNALSTNSSSMKQQQLQQLE
jgi:hypothetical protein